MSYKAIGFDYDGVTVLHPGPPYLTQISALLGVTLDELRNVYFKYNKLFNTNKVSLAKFWKTILADLGKSEQHAKLMQYIQQLPRPTINHQIVNLVDKLRPSGYKVGMLTNNTLQAAKRIRNSELPKHFDVIDVSAEMGVQKPEQEAFEIFAGHLGVKLNELIYIDDAKKSLEGIEEFGVHPIFFQNYDELIDRLSALGIKVTS